ncbi:MAG: hypothetical protein AB7O60_03260 [Variibacter sp.]
MGEDRHVRTLKDRDEWIRALLEAPDVTPGDKLIGVRLAMHMNMKSLQLNPSASRLAAGTGQTLKKAEAALSQLARAGWIERQRPPQTRQSKAAGRYSTHYSLTLRSPNEQRVITPIDRRVIDASSNAQASPDPKGDTPFERRVEHPSVPDLNTLPAKGLTEIEQSTEQKSEQANARERACGRAFEDEEDQRPHPMINAAQAIAEWRKTGKWNYRGPPPEQRGCLIPFHKQWEYGAEAHADDVKAASEARPRWNYR